MLAFNLLSDRSPAHSNAFGAALGMQIDRAAHPDILEMVAQKSPRRPPAAGGELLEEIIVGIKLRVGGERVEDAVERDAMHVDTAIFARALAARQPALVDKPDHEVDRAVFGEQRG